MARIFKFILNIFLIWFLLITLFFGYLSIFHKDIILEYLLVMKNLVQSLWYRNFLIIFLFAFFESFPLIWTSIPWQIVLITVAWFLWPKYLIASILMASTWALLGNYAGYLLWLKYWDWFFRKYWHWIGIWQTDIKYIKKWIEKNWRLFVVLGKFHNLLRAFVPFIAWTSFMKNRKFMFANIVWSILRAIVMVILWVSFVKNAEAILSNIWKIMLFILITFALYIFFFKKKELMIYVHEKNKELDLIIKKK